MVDVVTPAKPVRAGSVAGSVGSYVDWGSILAGAVVAAALSFVLLTAGAGIGLSLVSPYPTQSYGKFAATIAVFWALVVTILSFLAGGYIAGRMRAAWESATPDEVEFRDGVHGLLVWAVSIFIGGLLAFLTAASAAQLGAEAGKAALSDRRAVVAPVVDSLLRGTTVAQAGTSTARTPETTSPTAPTASRTAGITTQSANADTRDDVARALTAAVADGQLSGADRQYLAQVVSQRTGLPAAEAEKRVDEAYAQAVRAVDKARKAAVLAALVTATALLIGLAAAWYAAQHGGRHRDQNIPAKFAFLRRMTTRRTTTP